MSKKAIETYTALTKNEKEKELSTDSLPLEEIDTGKYRENELGSVLDAVVQKATLRSHATEFRYDADPDEGMVRDEVEQSELDIQKKDEIYVYSYEISTDERDGKKRGPLSSVYTMHLDESGVPVCSCPEIAHGGPICHHMVIHAKEVGLVVSVESD